MTQYGGITKLKYLDNIKKWLATNKAEIIIDSNHANIPAQRLFTATVNCKKYKTPVPLASLVNEIFAPSELVSAMTELNSLSNSDIDALIATTDKTDEPQRIFIDATQRFNEFISKYIMLTFSQDRKQIYMYKKFEGDRLISLHKLDDDLEDFFTQLLQDDRVTEFEQDYVNEFNNDYEFFSKFCSHKLDSAGKQLIGSNGNPLLIRPDVDKFINDILPRVAFDISPFPEVLSNDRNVPGFSNIYFDDLLNMQIGDIRTITDWLNSRFRPDQIDIIEKVIARSLIAHAPDIHGLYIYDPDGENGKSTLLNALAAAYKKLNIKCCNMTLSGIEDKHSYVQYFGASVAFNADVKSPNFIQTDLYHHVTGGDLVTIDPKGGMPFEANVKVTAILAGNIPIQFDTSKHHMQRRIFFIPMHKPDDDYIARNTVFIDGKREWKNQGEFAKTINEQAYYWMVRCFQKHYAYNLAENSIVQSKKMDDDTIEYCGENTNIEMNMIIGAMKDYINVTLDMNDFIVPEDLYMLFLNKTIYVPILNVMNNLHKSKIKNALINEILTYEGSENLNSKDLEDRRLVKGKYRRVICGVKLVKNSTEDSLIRRLKDNTNYKSIAEEMGVGCDYSHINDNHVAANIPAGCEDAEF